MSNTAPFLNSDCWTKNSDGMWIQQGTDIPTTAFSSETQKGLMELEDNSWWFRYRAKVIVHLMKRFFKNELLTVDIGGGNGYTSSNAESPGFRAGLIEPTMAACFNALARGLELVCCGALTDESVIDGSINQVLMLDVLEHIEDDAGMLKLLIKKMTAGGTLLITVPAFMSLWSSEDESAGHFRRYRIKSIEKLVEEAGLELLYSNYFMGFLYLPILLVRVWMEKIGVIKRTDQRSSEEGAEISDRQFICRNRIVNFGLNALQKTEIKMLAKSHTVPFGSSIVIVAKK